MNEKLEDADFVSAELQEKFYQLENDLEEAIEMCFGDEKLKMEKSFLLMILTLHLHNLQFGIKIISKLQILKFMDLILH